ncbi:hypothetical protein [Bradyrhizobium sp. B120]|uniref:hypothetical protein n=1 Tax=Bradyrhizobium sp. B120 TaxID=3410088 RepID=UPI003B9862EB
MLLLEKAASLSFGQPAAELKRIAPRARICVAWLDPGSILQRAYSTAECLLGSGKRLGDGEAIGVEGQARFKVSHADAGDLVSFPIARLSLQVGESWS